MQASAKLPCCLVLFTTGYPFGRSEHFLETELPYLTARFERVLLVPMDARGPRRPLPAGAQVDTSLAESRPRGARMILTAGLSAFRSTPFYAELREHPELLGNRSSLAWAVHYWADVARVRDWVLAWMRREGKASAEVIFYAYWLGRQAMGVGLARRELAGLRLIARAHGSDLYAYANRSGYLPFRRGTLAAPDRILTVSQHGLAYLAHTHPEAAGRAELARLGVRASGILCPASQDGVLRVVSCAYLEPLKRIDLLIRGLAAYATRHAQQAVEWHHLGDGRERERLEALAAEILPARVRWHFHGRMPNREVLAFYAATPLDVFVNVSASEGVPVSIMEAFSCGVPAIATPVGGTPELVNAENGWLLPHEPQPEAIADALEAFAPGSADASRREKALRTWQGQFAAETNYTEFVERLRTFAAGETPRHFEAG